MNVQKGSEEGEAIVQLTGNITENYDLFSVDLNKVSHLILDFQKVGYINSVGVKSWVIWTGRLNSEVQVIFRNCIPSVVNQINMVKGFMPKNSSVESILVPYFCDDSGEDGTFLAVRGKDFEYPAAGQQGWFKVPEKIKGPNGEEMELDTFPEKYFKFLSDTAVAS